MARALGSIRRCSYQPTNGRRGISLIEVVISMLVALVGLVSLAALVGVGQFEVAEGSKSDRGVAVARAAQRELKIRGMLRPIQTNTTGAPVQMWMLPNGNAIGGMIGGSPTKPFDYGDTFRPYGANPATLTGFVLDPLGVAANTDPDTRYFPSKKYDTLGDDGRLYRITLRSHPSSPTAMLFSQADSIFRSSDDLVLNPPTGDYPPTQLFSLSSGTPAKRQSQGDYSWMATIVPSNATVDGGDKEAVIVSIVVFYKRVTLLPPAPALPTDPAPPERMVHVNLTPAAPALPPLGIAGGEVQLLTDTGMTKAYLNLKAGQWIMLSQGFYSIGSLRVPSMFRWYKVLALDDIQGTGPWTRNVTLAGPDWNPNPAGTPGTPPTYASIFDGVVGVYEKEIEFEEVGSQWAP